MLNANTAPSNHASFLSYFARKRIVAIILTVLCFLLAIILWPIGAKNKELSCGHVGSCWEEDDCCIVSDGGVCGGSCFCSAHGSSSWYCEGEPKMAIKTGFMVPVVILFVSVIGFLIYLTCVGCRDYKNDWTGRPSSSSNTPRPQQGTPLTTPPAGAIQIEVTVPKGPMGLTMGQRGPNGGHLVDVVKDQSPLNGSVKEGDELLQINNTNLTVMKEQEMMETLRSLSDKERTLVLFREVFHDAEANKAPDEDDDILDEVDPEV